jgi:hypothetical protein
MMAVVAKEKKDIAEKRLQRDQQIIENVKKLEVWKRDLESKSKKKEEEARIAKERKDRLIEEVRRHFGFSVHPKDERFKELLEKKEKEQKKALKASKKQERDAKLLAKIAEKEKEAQQQQSKNENVDDKKD